MGDYTVNVSDESDPYFTWGDNGDGVTNFLFPKGRNDPDVFLPNSDRSLLGGRRAHAAGHQ